MINYLQIEGLTKSFGSTVLFSDISLSIAQGEKVGLIAQNGKGKTTLLRIIAGEEDYDSGSIVCRRDLKIGFLSQEPVFDPHKSLLQNVLPSSFATDEDRWIAEDEARGLLHKLGLEDPDCSTSTMSGGQLKRAAIVRLILSAPDMMVLDEPTNHLDIASVEWLENYLATQKTTLLMVTHDRYFLDNVCNRIIEIDCGSLYSYDGNYDYYLTKREERIETMTAELAKVKNLLRTELEWMRRQPQARGSKAKYRIDNFYELEKRSKVNMQEGKVDPSMMTGSYIGSKIFEAHDVCKAYGNKKILDKWNYVFARYDKIGIVGENGVGKTTFLRMLLGEEKPDSGHFDVGQTVRWGYYSQQGITDFDERKKVIDAAREIAEEVVIDEKTRLSASQFLNHFLFSVQDQQKYIYKLSGGERRRLNLAVVLMRNPNFLVFDEPTNDLDIVTLTILEDYIARFKGCVIVVSHDRFFLDRIANHLFVFRGDGKVEDFPGNYSTFREVERGRKEQQSVEISKPKKDTADAQLRTERRKKGLTYKETKEKEALEAETEALEVEKAELETRMSSGTMSADDIVEAGHRMASIISRLDEAEMRLLELMDKE